MSFDRNDYLAWYVNRAFRGDGAVNLHASGVHALELAPVQPCSHPFRASVQFEGELARWLGVPPEDVLFTPGATGGTLLALLTLARPGTTVLVDLPMYEPMVRQAGRLHDVRRLVRRFGDGWALPLDRAAGMLRDGNVSLVMLCEPGNPTGTFSRREDVIELARLADARGAFVLVNEVYRGFSDRSSFHGAAENVVVVSSLSKLIGVYSIRLGWLSGARPLIGRLRQGHINMGMGSIPSAVAGIEVLRDHCDRVRSQAIATSVAGTDIVDAWVRSVPGLAWLRPEGPGFGCVMLPAGMDDMAFAEGLHDRAGVLPVPGALFELPGTMRISWLQAGERLEEGLRAIGRAFRRGH